MALELDHAFICCSFGAPEADALVGLGFREGTANTHPGQGTANRRFFFDNAYLEFVWASSQTEALSEQTRRTGLWERCAQQASGANPFGVVFRPSGGQAENPPFVTWSYRPGYLPPGLAIEFAEGVPLREPALVYLPFAHRKGPPAHEPTDHPRHFRTIGGMTLGLPKLDNLSASSRAAFDAGLVAYVRAAKPVLEVTFLADEKKCWISGRRFRCSSGRW